MASTSMKAFQMVEWGKPAKYVDVPKPPSPGASDLLLRVAAVGLCHSDLGVMDASEMISKNLSTPFTLGHETAGYVEEAGSGVKDIEVGDAVLVHTLHHCNLCDFCLRGDENLCSGFKKGGITYIRGVGDDGGLAKWMVVPRSEVVKVERRGLDIVEMAVLTDAGVTAYHAVRSLAKGNRLGAGGNALVIGVGGLGIFGVQILKVLAPGCRVLAVDVKEDRVQLARDLGADEGVVIGEAAAEVIGKLTEEKGCDGIVDFVGNDETLELASRVARSGGRITVVGLGGGSLKVGWRLLPIGCEFATSLGSTRHDLRQVYKLYEAGKLQVNVERFSFDQIEEAYDRLRAGKLKGRAVIVMNGQ
ncbi:MAG: hypothetical protein Q9227_006229 [Pyrenula ochraceoflavens]